MEGRGKCKVSPESLFPTRLAHVLRLILGLCTSLIKTENVFKQVTHTAIPPSEGQHVLWGRNFPNALQIKLIRYRPDCQLPRSPCYMWRPASKTASSQSSHHPGTVRTSRGSTGSLSESKACPELLPPKPRERQQEPKVH